MRAVSDTSPLSNLAAIGRLPLLQSQFSEIWIAAVRQELDAHLDAAVLRAIQAALRENWIRCASPAASPLLNVLSMHLHRGEAEAIALAADLKVDVIIIDEQEGRELAAHAGLYVTGLLGILLRAKRNGNIPGLEPEIQALRAKARFFIPRLSKPRCWPPPETRSSAGRHAPATPTTRRAAQAERVSVLCILRALLGVRVAKRC